MSTPSHGLTPSDDPVTVRHAARSGALTSVTRGLAPGRVQCNLVVLPERQAEPFAAWCAANPDACPVLARSEVGDPTLPLLGDDLDLRTDLPRYQVFRDGRPTTTATDVTDVWRDDLVAFAFGCSFSLEELFRARGVDLAYEQRGFFGATYVTDRQTVPVGDFAGPLVVSMRPLRPQAAIAAVGISTAHPGLHGAPVHLGFPSLLGVDLSRPLDHLGDVQVADDELPVFWACGVTPQLALEGARPELAITHASGHMLVTDLRSQALATG